MLCTVYQADEYRCSVTVAGVAGRMGGGELLVAWLSSGGAGCWAGAGTKPRLPVVRRTTLCYAGSGSPTPRPLPSCVPIHTCCNTICCAVAMRPPSHRFGFTNAETVANMGTQHLGHIRPYRIYTAAKLETARHVL